MIKLHAYQAVYGKNPTEEQRKEHTELDQKAFESIQNYRAEMSTKWRSQFDILNVSNFIKQSEEGAEVTEDGDKKLQVACTMKDIIPRSEGYLPAPEQAKFMGGLAKDNEFENSMTGQGKNPTLSILTRRKEFPPPVAASSASDFPTNPRVAKHKTPEDNNTIHELDRLRKEFGLNGYTSSSSNPSMSNSGRRSASKKNSSPRPTSMTSQYPSHSTSTSTTSFVTSPPLKKTPERERSAVLPVSYIFDIAQGIIQDDETSPTPTLQRRVASLREKFEIMSESADRSVKDASLDGRKRYVFAIAVSLLLFRGYLD